MIKGAPSGMAMVMGFDSALAITGALEPVEYAALVPARGRGFVDMTLFAEEM